MTEQDVLDAEYEYQLKLRRRFQRRQRHTLIAAWAALIAIAVAIVLGFFFIVRDFAQKTQKPSRQSDHTVTMDNCYDSVIDAIFAGDEEDSVCATFIRHDVVTVHGPLWFMDRSRGDVEVGTFVR